MKADRAFQECIVKGSERKMGMAPNIYERAIRYRAWKCR
jgi:hypothetical protein